LSLGAAYVLNELIGNPYGWLTSFLDLNDEGNLPTWYSSIQWFCVATLVGIFAQRNFSLSERKSWLLLTLPLLFLMLSVDEVAQIHEHLGVESDKMLPGGSRRNTLFGRTGIWTILIGLPFLALFVALIFSLRIYFKTAPSAFAKIFLGMLFMLGGAIGIETAQNFITSSIFGVLQILLEELCEMLGATVVLWGSYELVADPESGGFI
jgi:hypothetical protein